MSLSRGSGRTVLDEYQSFDKGDRMTPTPTGWIDCSAEIPVLVFERALPVPIEAAWAVLTESQLTARWIGSWSGEAEPGKTIEVVWLA